MFLIWLCGVEEFVVEVGVRSELWWVDFKYLVCDFFWFEGGGVSIVCCSWVGEENWELENCRVFVVCIGFVEFFWIKIKNFKF